MTAEALATSIAVSADSPALLDCARDLAWELRLPLIDDPAASNAPYLLIVTSTRLELRQQSDDAPGPVYTDFLSGPLAYRRRFGGGRGQVLGKAIGLKRSAKSLRVLDATAGLGRDAFVLACLGCKVHMVERSPIVAALLSSGLRQAASSPEIGSVINDRLSLSVADSGDVLRGLHGDDRPDVVFLDPMYPHRTKSALAKKEMRVLRAIVGEDLDAPALLAAALICARRRVVVKRPKSAPLLLGPKPTLQMAAKNTRFDVYIVGNRASLSGFSR